jgi:hypothetical protein
MPTHARFLSLLTVGAIVSAAAASAVQAAGPSPEDARSTARAVALRWAANVPNAARLGTEPTGQCRRVDPERYACPIAIVVLGNDGKARRPWRCSATALITGDRELHGRRTRTHCAPFPPATTPPDPAGAIGTALALQANGDTACLPAHDRRVTCVMRYRGPNATHCLGAASVPVQRLIRSIALGPPRCE